MTPSTHTTSWGYEFRTTISDAVVHTLIDWGVDIVFGLPRDGINGFMEALRKTQGSQKP